MFNHGDEKISAQMCKKDKLEKKERIANSRENFGQLIDSRQEPSCDIRG